MVAFAKEYLPAETSARSQNRAECFFARAPGRAGHGASAARLNAGENNRCRYDVCRGASLAQREEALNAADDLHYKLQEYFAENPDGIYTLSSDELHTFMQADKFLASDHGFDKASFVEFNKMIQGGQGDGRFINFATDKFRLQTDLVVNGETLFSANTVFQGSDINYYFMGYAHAARGASQFMMKARIIAYNHAQAQSGINVQHNINQQTVGPKWAEYGYNYWGK